MDVLGVDQQVRKGADPLAHAPEGQGGPGPTFNTDLPGLHREPRTHYPVGKAKGAVEFQRTRLHPERAGLARRPWLSIYDADRHPHPGEDQGQHETGRTCADDKDRGIALPHGGLPRVVRRRLS